MDVGSRTIGDPQTIAARAGRARIVERESCSRHTEKKEHLCGEGFASLFSATSLAAAFER